MIDCSRFPKGALLFALIPISFNVLIWQNYPVSAQCLLPGALNNCGSTIALTAFGLAFGTFTALLATACWLTLLNFCSVFKNAKINDHVQRHQLLYAYSWIVAFTMASFAGFMTIICFRDASAATFKIYTDGLQGFFVAGIGAGSFAIVAAAMLAAIRHRARLVVQSVKVRVSRAGDAEQA
jgi:hypothetical protein